MELYVKHTSNAAGHALTVFETLSATWTGESVLLPLGTNAEAPRLPVVGWTDLYGGSACPINMVKVRYGQRAMYLVYGGNAGIRALDESVEPLIGINDHLPPGLGFAWAMFEDIEVFPADVQVVIAADQV